MRNAVLTLLLGCIVLALPAAVLAQPRLEIDETTFDFGYVPQRSVISHDFWLRSTGTDSLLILKVTPG